MLSISDICDLFKMKVMLKINLMMLFVKGFFESFDNVMDLFRVLCYIIIIK